MGFGPIYKRGFFNHTNVFNYARVFFFRFPVASAELLPPHLCLQFVPPIYTPIVGRFHEKNSARVRPELLISITFFSNSHFAFD
jgi:hypothetical protein